ncbi:MAG: UbiA family prenyltransferase [Planctomycetes bacterium]|nr:UbiA family prenyltransferase [Planctomycetota bacterium]
MKYDLTKLAYASLLVGFFVISTAWAFELSDNEYNIEKTATLLSLTIISLLAVLNLSISFTKLVRLPEDTPSTKIPRKSVLWLMIVLDTVIFAASAFMLNLLNLFLMPLIFLILALYPITKYTTFLSHFFFGLCFAVVPIYVWAAIWGSFFTISKEFAVQPFILSFILLLWATTLNINRYMIISENKDIRRTIPQNLGIKVGKFAINLNISVILGLLFFLTVINGHTFIIWIGLILAMVFLLQSSQTLRRETDEKSSKRFYALNLRSVIAYTCFLIVDVMVESYVLH